jgi:hypothetical protein
VALLENESRDTGEQTPDALIEEAREVQRRRYRRWGGGLLFLLVLAGGLLLLFGGGSSPAVPSGSAPAVIHSPLPSGIAARAADPSGGLPWGTRLVRTRGWTCVQVGRLSGNQLGEVGVDDVYHNDGLFHPFPIDTDHHNPNCVNDDGAGNAFMTVELGTMPESSVLTGWNGSSGCDLGPEVAQAPTCPAADERFIEYGLLGPQAKSITYTYNGHLVTEPTGVEGAYLVVAPATSRFCAQFGRGTTCGGSGEAPNSIFGGMITSVQYRNGQTCRPSGAVPTFSGCPEVGYVAPTQKPQTNAHVKAPVTAKVVAAKHYCFTRNSYFSNSQPAAATQITYIPCDGSVPATEVRDPENQTGTDIIFSWTARKPSTTSSRYETTITWVPSSQPHPIPQGCPGGGGGTIVGRVRAGERLTRADFVPAACTGRYTGTVYYDPNIEPGNAGGANLFRPGQNGAIPVGHFRAVVH